MCSNRNLFVLQKCGRDINCSLDYGSWEKNPTSRNPNQNRAAGGFFYQLKVRQPIGRAGFIAKRDLNKQDVGFIFAWTGSEFWSLFKYSRVKLKNQKPTAFDVLFKAYPMVPLSCRSNLAGQ
jgi:hypothetical protein